MTAPEAPRPEIPAPIEIALGATAADDAPPPRHPKLARALRLGLRIIPIVMLGAVAWVLWREFHKLSWDAVQQAIAGWGWMAIGLALLLSVWSFLLMGLVEWVGLRWMGAKVPFWATQAGSFLANAIAHAIGANLLVSSAVRARFYDRYKVGLTQVAGTTLFAAMSFAVGLSALSGGGLVLASDADLSHTTMSVQAARGLGWSLLAFAGGYILLCAIRRRPFTAFGRSVTLPSVTDALAQLVLGVIDNGTAAAILWILLPGGGVSYVSFVGAYAIACVVGLVSSVPGGAGVFESAMAALLPGVDAAALAAAFLGYRLAYYLAPLVIAAAWLGIDTILHGARRRS